MPKKPRFHSVRITADHYKTLQKVLAQVSSHGWRRLGISREEPASLSSLLGYAIEKIEKDCR